MFTSIRVEGFKVLVKSLSTALGATSKAIGCPVINACYTWMPALLRWIERVMFGLQHLGLLWSLQVSNPQETLEKSAERNLLLYLPCRGEN